MIRPVRFGFNPETASDNVFQVVSNDESENIQKQALKEFNKMVDQLRANEINVLVVDDTLEPHTPDSIFPNNWVSFHENSNGTICLYPMYATNRRAERKMNVLHEVLKYFQSSQTLDLTYFETENKFLEGTGSLVLDRENKISYACISNRTDTEVVNIFCDKMGFTKSIIFEAKDENNIPIYHTNVLMFLADKYAVICLEAIRSEVERNAIVSAIVQSGKEIIEIKYKQWNNFVGNMLQVQNRKGENFLVMSSRAYESLTNDQIAKLKSYNQLIHSDLTIIESNGGGSARCMMAEIYLPLK